MNGKPAYTIVPPVAAACARSQDEWGMFDPNQGGLKAAFRAVQRNGRPPTTTLSSWSRSIATIVLELIFPDDLPAPDSAPHEDDRSEICDPPQPAPRPRALVSQRIVRTTRTYTT